MTIDCLCGHMRDLRSLISADAPLDRIIKQTHAVGEMLATSTQVYVADREGWRKQEIKQ